MAEVFDAYVRVSRVGGRSGERFISPEVQLEQIERWAQLRQVAVGERHEDLDRSGGTTDRPGLAAAISRVERGVSTGIVVARLDRLARSLSGALEVIQRVERANGQVVSVAEGIDPTTPAGKMMQRLLLLLAEWELDRLRESWRTARSRAIGRGVHISGRVPAGYRRREDGRLEPDPDHGRAVAEAFVMRGRGESWARIARYLTARGVAVNTGAPAWRPKAVQSLVANRVYLGEARSGALRNPSAHEPLVARDVWEAAQSARSLPTGRGAEPGLLAGLIRCSGCRYLLAGDKQTVGEARVHQYRCGRHHAPGSCAAPAAVSGALAEPYVIEQFFAHAGDIEASASRLTCEVDARRAAVVEAEAELHAFRDDERIMGALGPERFVGGLETRAHRLTQAQEALDAALRVAGPLPNKARLTHMWPRLAVRERQALLAAAIDCIFLRRGRMPIEDRLFLCWSGEGPGDLPARGKIVPLQSFDWPH